MLNYPKMIKGLLNKQNLKKNKLIFPGKKKDKSILFDLFYKFNGFRE